jgi:hypothetical protein
MIRHYPKLPIEDFMSVNFSLSKVKADRHENIRMQMEYGWSEDGDRPR